MNFYKTLSPILSLVFLSLLLVACADEEALTPNASFTGTQTPNANNNNSSGSTSSFLVGQWKMVSLDYTGTSTNMGVTSQFSGVGRDFTYVINFNDNPKTYTTSGGYTVDLTSTIAGSSFVTAVPFTSVVSNGTWSLNGNQITFVDGNTNETSTTDILSNTNNSFAIDYAGFAGQSQGGADVQFSSGQVVFNL